MGGSRSGLGAVPALIILIMRHDVPDDRGCGWSSRAASARPKEGPHSICTTTGSTCCRTPTPCCRKTAAFRLPCRSAPGSDPLASDDLRLDRLLRAGRASSRPSPSTCRCCSRMVRGLDPARQTTSSTMALFCLAAVFRLGRAAADAPGSAPSRAIRGRRFRHRAGVASLIAAAAALYTDHKYVLPFAAAGMLVGATIGTPRTGMTIPTMVAKTANTGERRAAFAYMFRQAAGISWRSSCSPRCSRRSARPNATLFVAIFPLIGLFGRDLHLAGGLRPNEQD